jgi:hypothetical protein
MILRILGEVLHLFNYNWNILGSGEWLQHLRERIGTTRQQQLGAW